MKNLFKIGLCGLFALCLSLTLLNASAASRGHFKYEKTMKDGKLHVISAYQNVTVEVAEVNFETAELLHEEKIVYLYAGNDPKPDNTNYQLILKQTLKLHKAIRDC